MDYELSKKFEHLIKNSNDKFLEFMQKSAEEAFANVNQMIKDNYNFISVHRSEILETEFHSIKRCIDICVDGFIDYFFMKFPDCEKDFDIPNLPELAPDKLKVYENTPSEKYEKEYISLFPMVYPKAAFWGDITPHLLYTATEQEYKDFISLKDKLKNG